MSDEVYGVPADKIPTLVRQLEEINENWAKLQPLYKAGVASRDRHALLWELVRRGDYPAWDDPVVWETLASESGMKAASAQDIVDFLSKVSAFDKERDGDDGSHDDYYDDMDGYDSEPVFESFRLARFWPWHLDTMAMHAYAEDRELVEEAAHTFSEDLQQGLQLVRRRFGVIKKEEVADEVVNSLASVDVWQEIPGPIVDWEDGELITLNTNRSGDEREIARRRFLDQFADAPTWGRALLKALGEEHEQLPIFNNLLPAWPFADTEQLANLLEHIKFRSDTPDRIYELMAQRDDEPGALMEIAQIFVEKNKNSIAELVAICAILSAQRCGQPAPTEALEMIEFNALSLPGSHRNAPGGLDALVQALRAIGEEAAIQRFVVGFGHKYYMDRPLIGICAFPDSEDLLARAFDLVEEIATGESGKFNAMNKSVLGLSLVGPSLLDRLVQEFEAADHAVLRDTYRRAILGILADMEEPADEAYDGFISLVNLEDKQVGDGEISREVVVDYLAVLQGMPEERAVELIVRDLSVDAPTWPRAIAAVRAFQNPEIFAALFARIAAGHSTKVGRHDWFGEVRGIYNENQDAIKLQLGPVLVKNDDTDLHNTIRAMIGDEVYDDLLASAGTESVADADQAAKIRRLTEAYFESNPDAARCSIFLFERGDEPPQQGTLNRIGGRPFGVDTSSWPMKNGDDALPMTHLFTLDLKETPGIAALFEEGTRALSLFVRFPGTEAWSPHNADSEVLVFGDDEVQEFEGEMPVGDDQALAFSVEEVEVPREAFSVQYGTNPALEEIKNSVYQARAWGGAPVPIWLQSEEYTGTFVMQFDEGFASMSLGDCGIMYVFADTAFGQSH